MARNADELTSQAIAMRDQGRIDEALKLYDEALTVDPSHTFAWINKGASLHQAVHRGFGVFGTCTIVKPERCRSVE